MEKYNWKQIDCISAGNIKTIDDIHEEIYEAIIKKL